jgi:molybdopterin synthase catalytic subunit
MDRIAVLKEPIESEVLVREMASGDDGMGAVVTFAGRVRGQSDDTERLFLEHYPAMTQKALERIVADARDRWSLGKVLVLHRVGELCPGDTIVFVGVSASHRKDAFEAAEFIMDILKTQVPFWKKERKAGVWHWVRAKDSDNDAALRWLT